MRALDGEGGRTLTLLGSSERGETIGGDLSSWQSLNHLLSLPRVRRNVWWHLDWDVNTMLADLPEPAIRSLVASNRAAWRGVDIYYVPGHIFRVSRGAENFYSTDLAPWGRSRSLVDTCDEWGIPLADAVREGKDDRPNLATWPAGKVLAYNASEVRSLSQLADSIYRSLAAHGLRGDFPGACAKNLLHDWGAEHWRRDCVELGDLAELAYAGGRVEAAGWGTWRGPVYAYDLSGAYAWALSQLPNLAACRWVREPCWPAHPFDLVHVRWERTEASLPRWNPLPVRHPEGGLGYPDAGQAWVWGCDLQAATLFAGIVWEVLDCYRFHEAPDLFDTQPARPFADPIARLYGEREAFTDSPSASLIKSVLVSVYGQLARPQAEAKRYASRVWAGLVCALVRSRLNRVLAEHGEHVVAVLTDGFLSTRALPISMPGGLGGWRLQQSTPGPLHLIQPGIASAPTPKSRGHRLSELPSIPAVVSALWDAGPFAEVEYPRRHFVTMHDAVTHNRFDLWRQWRGEDAHVRVIDRSAEGTDPFAGRVRSPRVGTARSSLFEGRIEGEWEWLAPVPTLEAVTV